LAGGREDGHGFKKAVSLSLGCQAHGYWREQDVSAGQGIAHREVLKADNAVSDSEDAL
jgi:hypothetical protein